MHFVQIQFTAKLTYHWYIRITNKIIPKILFKYEDYDNSNYRFEVIYFASYNIIYTFPRQNQTRSYFRIIESQRPHESIASGEIDKFIL